MIELRFVGINVSRALATGGFNTSIASFLANVLNRSPSIFTVVSVYPAPAPAATAVAARRQRYYFRSLRALLTPNATITAAATSSTNQAAILALVTYHSQNPSTNEMSIALSAGILSPYPSPAIPLPCLKLP